MYDKKEKTDIVGIAKLSCDSLVDFVGKDIDLEVIQSEGFVNQYSSIKEAIQYLTELKNNIDETVKECVKNNFYITGSPSIKTDSCSFTYIPETTRETFDSKRFRSECPDLYKQYVKISNVDESIRVTMAQPTDKKCDKDVGDVVSE